MKAYLEQVAQAAKENIPVREEDYVVDGIIHCGRCGEAKEKLFMFQGSPFKVMMACKCEAEARDNEYAERQAEQERYELERMQKAGFPDLAMRNWTFENDDGSNPYLLNISRNYVKHFPKMLKEGKGLLLYGAVGTGKTYAAASIANELVKHGSPCMVTNFTRITNILQGRFEDKQAYIDSLNKYSLLVIDDLAAERDTEYMNGEVMSIIDERYRVKRPIIVTTNLTAEELMYPKDIRKERIFSRLREMCAMVNVKGHDRRTLKLKDNMAEMSKLLGI